MTQADELKQKEHVFCFGSNEIGLHGAGSARAAYRHHGAVWGMGAGFFGRSYAIPTKDRRLNPLPLKDIEQYVSAFLEFARLHQEFVFDVVRVGCGLAGFSESQIRPMFLSAPSNCNLPPGWRQE